MDTSAILANISAFFTNISDGFYTGIASLIKFLALAFLYYFMKNSSEHDQFFLIRDYMTIFKSFGEFMSAVACVVYGIIEMNSTYLIGGIFGIMMGYLTRTVFRCTQDNSSDRNFSRNAVLFIILHVLTVYACSAALLNIVIATGAIPCFTKVMMNVLPMMALAKSLKSHLSDNFFLASIADFFALAVFWWHCTGACIKYFIVVPNVMAVVLTLLGTISAQLAELLEGHTEEDEPSGEMIFKRSASIPCYFIKDDIAAIYEDLEEGEEGEEGPENRFQSYVRSASVVKRLNMNRSYKRMTH